MHSAELVSRRVPSKPKKAFGLFQEVKSAVKHVKQQESEHKFAFPKDTKIAHESDRKQIKGIGKSLENTDHKQKNYYRTDTKKKPLQPEVLCTKWDTSYTRDYFSYLRHKELDSIIALDDCNRLAGSENGSWLTIIDWMVEVQEILNLSSNTIYLAVYILKKVITTHNVSDNVLPKFGISSLFVASKFEDVVTKCLNVDGVSVIADRQGLQIEDILQCEADILESNFFKIGLVTVFTFIQKVECIMKSSKNIKALHFLGIATLYSIKLNSMRPSLVAFCLVEFLNKMAATNRQLLDDNGDFEHVMEYLDLQLVEAQEHAACARLIYTLMNQMQVNHHNAIEAHYQQMTPLLQAA